MWPDPVCRGRRATITLAQCSPAATRLDTLHICSVIITGGDAPKETQVPPKIDLSEVLFSKEAEAEVLRLGANQQLIHDRDYFHRTADMVADGFDPRTRQSLTTSGLRAWVARCEGIDRQNNENETAHNPTAKNDPNPSVCNPRKIVHPRRIGPLFEHSE